MGLETLSPQERDLLTVYLQEMGRRQGQGMLSTDPQVKESVERIRLGGFLDFVKEAWHLVEPSRPLVMNFQIEAVCAHLQAVSEGRIKKLIINIPPGTSKSTLVSVLWPCWEWTFRPFLRWMFASYNERLSLRDSVRRRDVVIASDWYQARWGGVFSVQKDNERYYTNSVQGSMYSTSTGGSVTGFRAERLCVASGTKISTKAGDIDVDDLVRLKSPPLVLTWNHEEERLEYCKLRSSSRRPSKKRIVAVGTVRGRHLECTEDHPVFAAGAYREAALLKGGEALVSVQLEVLPVQEGGGAPAVRGSEGSWSEGEEGLLLLPVLFEHLPSTQADASVRDLRETGVLLDEVLREGVLGEPEDATRHPLSNLCCDVSAPQHQASALLKEMRGSSAFAQDDGAREFSIHDRKESWQFAFQAGIEGGTPSGRECLRGVRRGEQVGAAQQEGAVQVESSDPSHRREPIEQHASESCDALPYAPRGTPQVEDDSVSVVEFVRGPGECVYDLTIEGNHNFFANGVLVHNCIDDPHDPKGAMSDIQREGTEEWLKLTWPTRMNETLYSAQVVVMQRLHVDDCSGIYLRMGGWDNLKIPMEYKGKKTTTSIGWTDPRQTVGELLDERVYNRERVENDKKLLGAWGEAGQFDQEPTPIGGGIIKSSWLKRWKWAQGQPGQMVVETRGGRYSFDPKGAFRFGVADLAMTEKEIGAKKLNDPDWTVFMSCVALSTPEGTLLCVMDVQRMRMEGPDTLPQLAAMHKRDRFALIGVENIGNKMWYQIARRDPWRLPVREISNRVGDDVLYTVDRDKVGRALAASYTWSDARVFIPEYSPWEGELFQEMDNFPNYPHDDQVDCLVYSTVIAERYKGNPLRSNGEPREERNSNDRRADAPENPLERWESNGGLQGWGSPL